MSESAEGLESDNAVALCEHIRGFAEDVRKRR